MIAKIHCSIAALFLSLALFLTTSVFAQNKVVVIPLMEEAPTSEPYAPLADTYPPSSSYSLGTNYIVDKVTGLIWQEPHGSSRTWNDAWDYCQDLELDGKTDWRLPDVDELISIVHYGHYDPAINTVVFPGTQSSYYWSATNQASDSGGALVVNFKDGGIVGAGNSYYRRVRCVRRLSARDSAFKNNGNGTVTDLATGLTWQRQDDNGIKEWDEAVDYCQALDLAGGGWRLPAIKELQSIVDRRVNYPGPAIDTGAFPGTESEEYWSVTTTADNSEEAWSVDFDAGRNQSRDKLNSCYVRCVRSQQ